MTALQKAITHKGTAYALLITVFVIATCGLIYELIAGTVASYLLGDSITQFSTVIGVYLFSMGIGSYLSRFVRQRLVQILCRSNFLLPWSVAALPAFVFVF